MAGKGSRQRPTDTSKYHANWDRLFGSKDRANTAPLSHEPGMSTSCIDCPKGTNGVTNDR